MRVDLDFIDKAFKCVSRWQAKAWRFGVVSSKAPGMAQSVESQPKTLVFLLTEDWFFASHFWVRGLAARAAGWRVVLVAHESAATARIRASGIEVVPVDFIRRRLNPFAELWFT